MKAPIKGNASFVDDKKVSDHHAIIPTEQGVDLRGLEYGERKIYELIVSRFLAVLMPPCEYQQTQVTAVCQGERFSLKGRVLQRPGWQEVKSLQAEAFFAKEEDEERDIGFEDEEAGIPDFFKGQKIAFTDGGIVRGKTKPPAPFTEATLLAAMENPVKYMEGADKKLRQAMGEAGGLGTVATRADIIEKLFHSFMIEKKDQSIRLTSKGRQVLDLAPQELTSPELTARWEQELTDIARGKAKKKDFEARIRVYAADIVKEIKASSKAYRHDNLTSKKCPECGKLMLEVNHKNGRMLVCQDRECGYRKSLSRVTNARCPKCHKKMELTGEGEGRRFVCACGYREKLSAFEKRRKENGGGASKKDVSRYMNQVRQEAKEPVNHAFADALAKIKL